MKNKNEIPYRSVKIKIFKSKNPMVFEFFQEAGIWATEIYNRATYVLKTNYSAHQKHESEWTDEERDINQKLSSISKIANKDGSVPKIIDARQMHYYFSKFEPYKEIKPKYFPYMAIREPYERACHDVKSADEGKKSYEKNSKKFSGEPQFPKYKPEGEPILVRIHEIGKRVKKDKEGRCFFTIPNIKKEPIFLSNYFENTNEIKTIEAEKVDKETFLVRIVFEDNEYKQVIPKYYAGIDLGVSNLMTVVSNCEKNESLIFNGRVIKSINQGYNKNLKKLYSQNTKGHQIKEGELQTKRMRRITEKRNNRIDDQIKKMSKILIDYCLENHIGTIVIGDNKMWKQKINIGRRNNQKFVNIPFEKLKKNIEYRAKRHGIKVIRREESYTSKADYLSKDYMPPKRTKDFVKNFSGKRKTRGMYESGTGVSINADCNGAANILRKEFPEIEISLESLQNVRKIKKVI